MTTRNRMTWSAAQAGRRASAPPATPGYNVEDQDHPAHQPDPEHATYAKGDPSAWAEDPRKPPYPQGNPPSTPGYDVEDQDHPAHKEPPRWPLMAPQPKQARSLRAAVERKAAKCIRIAQHMLGPKAKQAAIEDQALALMDMDDMAIEATLKRLGGGFLAEAEVPTEAQFEDDFDAPLPDMDDLDLVAPMPDLDDDLLAPDLDDEFGMLAEEEAPVACKCADQNDPKGPTLAPGAKDEDAARKPEVTKEARRFFASMDTDRDGFLMAEDWKGSKTLFAAIDTDGDGIVSEKEVVAALAPGELACGPMADDDLGPEEAAMLAEMMKEEAGRRAAAKKAEQKAAAKKADDDEEEEAEEEAEEETEGEEEAKPEAEEEGTAKEAGMFGLGEDPMGATGAKMSDQDRKVLASIFGKAAGEEEEAEHEAAPEEEEPKEAKKKAGVKGKKAQEEEEAKEAEGEEEEPKEAKAKKATKKAEDEEPAEEEAEEEAPKESAKKSGKKATKKAEDEEPAEAEEEEPKEAKKKAAQRPQPRKASQGVKTVGTTVRTAAANSEVAELSKLWATDPDVTHVFG